MEEGEQKIKICEPNGFLKPGPVQRSYRFWPVQSGFSGFLTGSYDLQFSMPARTGITSGSRSNRLNRPVRSGFHNIDIYYHKMREPHKLRGYFQDSNLWPPPGHKAATIHCAKAHS
jgi:hypothetical protein